MTVGRGTTQALDLLVLVALCAAAVLASVLPQHTAVAAPAAKVDAIVRFAPGVSAARQRELVRAAGGTVSRDLHLIGGLGARLSPAAVARLRGAAGVERVSVAAPVVSRAGNARDGANGQPNAYAGTIGAPNVWRNGRGYTGRSVGVAVIDTGVAGDLPDFDVSDDNRRSRVATSVVVNPAAGDAEDHYGHGTHVAGIIGGDGTNRRRARDDYVGVAPGAQLVSVKISGDDGSATTLDAIYGIQFAVDHAEDLGIRVINLSLASTVAESPATDPLDAAVEAAWLKGLVVVAAAGNDGDDASAVSYAPGNDPFVLTVGATDDEGTEDDGDDELAPWSSHGRTQTGVDKPEVVAPGSHIVSTLAPDSSFARQCPDCVVDRNYFRAGGTSMSAAVVSGAAALVLDANPGWTPDQVKSALITTARRLKPGRQIRVDRAIRARPDADAVAQRVPVNPLVNPRTGDMDYTAASWRAASWRRADRDDPDRAAWAAASWRCDCDLAGDGTVDPQAASWRAASWRVSFTK